MCNKRCEELPMEEFRSSSIKLLPGQNGNTVLHTRPISGCQSKCQTILEKHLKRTEDGCEMNKSSNTVQGTTCKFPASIVLISK